MWPSQQMASAAQVNTSTFSWRMTQAGILSVMTVTSNPMSRQTVAVSRAPWKKGRVSGQKRRMSFPCRRHWRSIMPTMVSPKHWVITVPWAGNCSARYPAIRSTLP